MPCVLEYARLVRMPRPIPGSSGWSPPRRARRRSTRRGAELRLDHWAAALPLIASLPAVLEGDVRQGGRPRGLAPFGLLWLGALAALVTLGHRRLALVVAVSVADVGAWCAGKAWAAARLAESSVTIVARQASERVDRRRCRGVASLSCTEPRTGLRRRRAWRPRSVTWPSR